jgi:hypothetical protein
MDFKVAQIGDATSNGNRIVKLQRKINVETVLGTMRKSETYYMAVEKTSVKVALDQNVDLDPAQFNVTERPFVLETGDNAGETVMLKWLSIK